MTYDGASEQWHSASRALDTAVSLRVSAALSHLATLPGSQNQPAPEATDAQQPEPTLMMITSTEFAFTPSELEIPAGTELTLRLVNDGQIPHNVRIDDLGVSVEAKAGATTELTFTTPSGSGTFEFRCDIPGHADGGMRGVIQLAAVQVAGPIAPAVGNDPAIEQPVPVVAPPVFESTTPTLDSASRASVPLQIHPNRCRGPAVLAHDSPHLLACGISERKALHETDHTNNRGARTTGGGLLISI